jgi:hypothetical protein
MPHATSERVVNELNERVIRIICPLSTPPPLQLFFRSLKKKKKKWREKRKTEREHAVGGGEPEYGNRKIKQHERKNTLYGTDDVFVVCVFLARGNYAGVYSFTTSLCLYCLLLLAVPVHITHVCDMRYSVYYKM